ncbi:MAG: PTS glucose transporter subunit IIA [Erysipelotrichaceae bacterium]|jgi:PTS system glucose-specific IIA component|nr:PTS glucose transporter subunit IIA [Erysipelotrichaceae bacterium]MBQ1346392.1 PTS glucose transporter subunit IIA [Erysipelotrichaceae bacterium]MBQ1692475.1 PTS glucose transporter subunit IIA [Erysipelotrichaceae bacterium]MBQ1740213.1 PTS glucose transporter subunit IIA [Erysipelotrichaceae bacterium]MBQ1776183.1 PTS glucose transporter subunit IIA [Erysipelotrichaceae bacterium]
MGLFDKLFKKEEEVVLPALENVADEDIVAIADGELIDVSTVSDPVFAEQMMGKSTAFKFDKDKVVLCSPANGTLAVLFPTGHAYGIAMNNGVELLVHCGVDTVNAKGDGFKLLGKKQGDAIKAGDPIVEVDIKKLSKTYDMSTMLIITNANDKELDFVDPQTVTRGQKVIK